MKHEDLRLDPYRIGLEHGLIIADRTMADTYCGLRKAAELSYIIATEHHGIDTPPHPLVTDVMYQTADEFTASTDPEKSWDGDWWWKSNDHDLWSYEQE